MFTRLEKICGCAQRRSGRLRLVGVMLAARQTTLSPHRPSRPRTLYFFASFHWITSDTRDSFLSIGPSFRPPTPDPLLLGDDAIPAPVDIMQMPSARATPIPVRCIRSGSYFFIFLLYIRDRHSSPLRATLSVDAVFIQLMFRRAYDPVQRLHNDTDDNNNSTTVPERKKLRGSAVPYADQGRLALCC